MRAQTWDYQKVNSRGPDYVLVYKRQKQFQIEEYIKNLKIAGLDIDYFTGKGDDNVYAVIYGSNDVLAHFTIFFDLYLTMEDSTYIWEYQHNGPSCIYNELTSPKLKSAAYTRALETVAARKPTTYTNFERSLIISLIMSNTLADSNRFLYGYSLLIKHGIAVDAFPLHDGPWIWTDTGQLNDRQLLCKYWADAYQIYKKQPLHAIEKYFGTEIAFYFAFVEFFNCMLVPLSILGIIFFLIGVFEVYTGSERRQFCASNLRMCPTCADFKACPMVRLKDHCAYKWFTMLFDNNATYMFAVVTVIWSFMFCVLWRRYQSILQMKFNVLKYKYDVRNQPTYIEKVRQHPHQTKTQKLIPTKHAYVGVLGSILTIISIILIWVLASQYLIIVQLGRLQLSKYFKRHQTVITSILVSIFNWYLVWLIICPLLINIGLYLTNYEYNKTQKEDVDSNVLKIVLFTFPLYFGVLLYLSTIRSNFNTYPGSADKDYRVLALWGSVRKDICNPAGCIGDVTIQLLIIFISDIFFAICEKYVHRFTLKANLQVEKYTLLYRLKIEFNSVTHSAYFLHIKYKNIVMRYAMITFFSAACPLAPLFVLIYSAIKIRSDAEKMIKLKRPMSPKVGSIGRWNTFLHIFTLGGVFMNMATVAFASSYIAKLQYLQTHRTLRGYIKNSLSVFATKEYFQYEFENGDYGPNEPYRDDIDYVGTLYNLSKCHYPGHRLSANSVFRYTNNWNYWNLVTGKLFFLFVSEHILLFIGLIIYYAVPQMPQRVLISLRSREMEMYGDRYALVKESQRQSKVRNKNRCDC